MFSTISGPPRRSRLKMDQLTRTNPILKGDTILLVFSKTSDSRWSSVNKTKLKNFIWRHCAWSVVCAERAVSVVVLSTTFILIISSVLCGGHGHESTSCGSPEEPEIRGELRNSLGIRGTISERWKCEFRQLDTTTSSTLHTSDTPWSRNCRSTIQLYPINTYRVS